MKCQKPPGDPDASVVVLQERWRLWMVQDTVVGGADEGYAFDESLGGFAADGASVDEGEAPLSLDDSL